MHWSAKQKLVVCRSRFHNNTAWTDAKRLTPLAQLELTTATRSPLYVFTSHEGASAAASKCSEYKTPTKINSHNCFYYYRVCDRRRPRRPIERGPHFEVNFQARQQLGQISTCAYTINRHEERPNLASSFVMGRSPLNTAA